MAKASVKLTCKDCGREFWHEKRDCGNRATADSYESWARDNINQCPECWAAEQTAKREATKNTLSASNAELAASFAIKLPALQGSDKQVAWATDIRNSYLAAMVKRGVNVDKLRAAINSKNNSPNVQAEVDSLMCASAKVWIDNKGKQLFGLYPIDMI